MLLKTIILSGIFTTVSCNSTNPPLAQTSGDATGENPSGIIKNNPYAGINEIPLPPGFTRISKNGFGDWLASVRLKKDRTVYLYDGRQKINQSAQFAVLDISVGHQDLQQCADAVMRLRAEYLFAAGQYQNIHFSDNEGKVYQFAEPFTAANLHHYLQTVFGMCGTASLSKQLHSISLKDIQPGDVIIRGGFPGHAVIVMDAAQNKDGEKIYLLAQSYMPAQDIHVLLNPDQSSLSPWFKVDDKALIETPEYIFTRNEVKRW